MAEQEVVHVAIAPPTKFEQGLVKQVAAIVAKNLYETQLRLTGKIPRIIANYGNMQMAESTARSLRELGLVVIVCTDSELRQPSQIYRARTMKFEEQAALFLDRDGQARRVDVGQIFLILSGRMQTETQTEVTKTRRKLNVTATLLMGGIPISKKVKEKTTSKSYQTESFVRLYGKMSPDIAVEILQQNFDYSFLGAEMTSSSVTNFSAAIRKIREAFPQAIFDDRLVEPFGADVHSAVSQDNIDMNCKLIYWYHKAVGKLGPSIQPQH